MQRELKMTKAHKNNAMITSTDDADFASILGIIATHRSRALMSVNVESLLTYWEIGAFLSPRIHSGSWSTSVVGKLADYIKRNQPELRGIFQPEDGKSSREIERSDFFQSSAGKSET